MYSACIILAFSIGKSKIFVVHSRDHLRVQFVQNDLDSISAQVYQLKDLECNH